MKRLLILSLALVMLLSSLVVAQAETTWKFTYWDKAETQLKTSARYEDGVLAELWEYPIPGDTTDNYKRTEYNIDTGFITYSYEQKAKDGKITDQWRSRYNDEGKLVNTEYTTYDNKGNRAFYEDTYYIPSTGKVRSVWQTTYGETTTKEIYTSYKYKKDELLSYYVRETLIDNETYSTTYETNGYNAQDQLVMTESGAQTYLLDAWKNHAGYTTESTVKYLNSDGEVENIETASSEYRYHGRGTRVLTSADGEGLVTSSQERTENWGGAITDAMNKGSLYDEQTGELIASAEYKEEKDYVLDSSERILTNQDGTVLATEVSARTKDGGGIATKTQYFAEDTGKLRKTVDEVVSYDEKDNRVVDTIVTNAADVVVEKWKWTAADGVTTIQRMDSITGKLKSTETYGYDTDADGNEFFFNKVADANGKLLSHRTTTYLPDEEEGTGYTTDIRVERKFDPETGKEAAAKTYKTFFGTDKKGNEIESWRVYDAKGNLEYVETTTDLYEDKKDGTPPVYIGNDEEYFEYEDGKEILVGRSEYRYLYNKEGDNIGYTRVQYNADGSKVSEYKYDHTYDADNNQIGGVGNTTDYNVDGTVYETSRSTDDWKNGTYVYERWNAKGTLLYKSTNVKKQQPFYPGYDNVQRSERTVTEESYSEHTGNLITTTVTKSTRANTGAYAENMVREKASGVLAGTSHLSYMYVKNYGYLNYQNYYTDYLYRATGELKYVIDGTYLIDNYYLNQFLDTFGWGREYTEHLETKTTAEGILARDYHWKQTFRESIENEVVWWGEYTSETKVYDEKTGELKSIETTTQVHDEVTGKTVFHTLVHNAAGQLIGDYTYANIEADELTDWQFLGESNVAFNDAGQTIKTYSDDGSGVIEQTNITHDTKGAVIIKEQTTINEDGTVNTEVITYDANGAPIRKSVTSNTPQDEDGAITQTETVYDGSGNVISKSSIKEVYDADYNRTYYREDYTDTAGRAVYYEEEGGKATRTFYEDDNYRVEVTEGQQTNVYDGNMKLLSTTTYEENGESCTKDAAGNVLSYSKVDDFGNLNEFFADGKVKTAYALDDDGELRETSFDKDGYIEVIKITHPEKPYTMFYDGDGKVAAVSYMDGEGRTAYYDAAERTWYSGTGTDRVAIEVPEFASEIDMSDINSGGRKRPLGVWYPDNTACTFGIHLRDIMPDLTSKWYTVTPIDVSQDGVQSFELVGSNMYIIGQVNVAVQGDDVTVTYNLIREDKGRNTVSTEYMNIFNNLNSITVEALEGDIQAGQGYAFGQPISIEKDLGGDTNVLLYVRNVVTYNTRVYGDQYLVRMWPNTPERKVIREGMINLMEPLGVE